MSTTPERTKLNLTAERAREILGGDDDAYRVISDKITSTGRWSVYHALVIQRVEDGRFFRDSYSVGATENQYESPWEYDAPAFTEVFPKEQVTITYV